MKSNEKPDPIEALACAWTVETTDLSGRVAAAIGQDNAPELLAALIAIQQELADLRQITAGLQEEVVRLRANLAAAGHRRPSVRLAPYSPPEGLVRLS